MELYLVQHGEAKSETEDPQRSLTERGKSDVKGVAEFARRSGIRPVEIRHSGKKRAEETALIFAESLDLTSRVKAVAGLAPNDDVEPVANWLHSVESPIMLVGHLPFLSRLASLLIGCNPELSIVRFRMGGLVSLVRENQKWMLAWMIIPDLL